MRKLWSMVFCKKQLNNTNDLYSLVDIRDAIKHYHRNSTYKHDKISELFTEISQYLDKNKKKTIFEIIKEQQSYCNQILKHVRLNLR